ncbi:hypothetical protein K438DRAFT_1860322 [Mycena galopus ATCC 62051]|nr:hypothetical protein K438DRAFT_1860322 [Mycena galopus ATCC 62051]
MPVSILIPSRPGTALLSEVPLSCPASPHLPARSPLHSHSLLNPQPAHPHPTAPKAFAILTNARLASFGKDNADAIRLFNSSLKQYAKH